MACLLKCDYIFEGTFLGKGLGVKGIKIQKNKISKLGPKQSIIQLEAKLNMIGGKLRKF